MTLLGDKARSSLLDARSAKGAKCVFCDQL